MPDSERPRLADHILVAGDRVMDHHLYAGDRMQARQITHRSSRWKSEPGGAGLLHKLIKELLDQSRRRCFDFKPSWSGDWGRTATHHSLSWETQLLDQPRTKDSTPDVASYAVWAPHKAHKDAKTPTIWRATAGLGYGNKTNEATDETQSGGPDISIVPDLLVIDDAGLGFREPDVGPEIINRHAAACNNSYILLKTTAPFVGTADAPSLWRELDKKKCLDKLICLVSARDLRRETLLLSHGLSWEASLEQLYTALQSHPAGIVLSKAQHLIVTFSSDAALWLDNTERNEPKAWLCFDPRRAEGEWGSQFEGEVFGYHTAMAAALALHLTREITQARQDKQEPPTQPKLNLLAGIEAGLLAMRELIRDGHGKIEIDANKQPDGFPFRTIAARILDARDNRIKDAERLASLPIEWKPAKQPGWSLIGAYLSGGRTFETKPLYHLAAQVVRYGAWTLDHLPHARFGKLMTPDRLEIESLRQIRHRLRDYRAAKSAGRPLSIGVFGPPGSGKSFGVQQLTEEIFGEASWFPFGSYSVFCWYGPRPMAPRIMAAELAV